MKKTPWWRSGTVYQIYPRSFQDSDGDGVGDLGGILRRLDYLSGTLGVDAVWLSPIYPSPMADFGYDVSDYCGVAPCFGDLETFDRLLAECHRRGIRLVMDYVPNHSSDRHPWFVESRSSKDNPKRDWYIWADGRRGGEPPNNWLSRFSGPAWTLDERTGQYYLHSFLKEQPDLNWRDPGLKEAMFGVLRFWLDRGVDGFRIDVAHQMLKDPLLRDNPPAPPGHRSIHKPAAEMDSQLHLHDMAHPDIHGLFREIRSLVDGYGGDRFVVGEIHEFDWKRWASYHGEKLDELHMSFNFSLLKAPWKASAVRRAVGDIESALPAGAWPNWVLGNHDEPRLATRIGAEQARVAALLLLTLRGTPFLYAGDELGMTDGEVPQDRRQDKPADPSMCRDGCRTPMQWDEGPNAGFSPEGVRTWLPPAGDFGRVSVRAQLGRPGSMLELYRSLLRLRREHAPLRTGGIRMLDGLPEDCLAYERSGGGKTLTVAANFSAQERELPLRAGRLLLTTALEGSPRTDPLVLRGREGAVLG